MEKYLKALNPLDEQNILSAAKDDITQRLVRLERKVDLLIDTLGGYGDYDNGHHVCNDLFGIETDIGSIYNFLKYGFPEAAKRAEENQRQHNEEMERLAAKLRGKA